MTDLYTAKKYFTTTEANLHGITKQELKADEDIVELGTFPIKNNKGKVSLEKLYAYNPELAALVKYSRKLVRKINPDQEKIQALVGEIEIKVRGILGFNLPMVATGTDDTKDSDTKQNNTEEVNNVGTQI